MHLVLITIALVFLLVILLFIFLYGKGKVYPGPSINIDSVKSSCNIACSDKNIYDYCVQKREINDGRNEKFEETCYNLLTNESYFNRNYRINSCSEIDCEKK